MFYPPNFGVKIDENVNSLKSNKITTPTYTLKSSPSLPHQPLRDQGVLWVQDTALKFTNGLGVTNTISSDTGGVTEVNTGAGLTGGPITSIGTISIPPGGVENSMLENSSILFTATNGIGGGGLVGLGGEVLLFLDQIEPVDSKTIYVSTGGSDSSGDGTILNPYASIQHAQSTISPSPTNRFLLVLSPGTYSGIINLKSNISLFGYSNQNTIISGNVIISDASWTGSGSDVSTMSNLTISGTSIFNFQTMSSQNGGIVFDHVVFSSVLSTTGSQNNSITTRDCVFLAGITSTGLMSSSNGSLSLGNVSFNASNLAPTTFTITGGAIDGDLNCNGLFGSQNVSGMLENCLVDGQIFVSGSNASLNCTSDVLSILPSVTNSGVLTITNYGNVGLNVDTTTTSTGGGLAGAYPIKNYFTRIMTNSAGNGVRLPSSVAVGSVFCVRNDSLNNLNVYPDSLSSQINGLPLGNPFVLAVDDAKSFIYYSSGVWCTIS